MANYVFLCSDANFFPTFCYSYSCKYSPQECTYFKVRDCVLLISIHGAFHKEALSNYGKNDLVKVDLAFL